MRKNLVLLVTFVSITLSAQTSNYVSVGMSMTNTAETSTFSQTTYPSLEFGVSKHDVSYGLAIGTYSLSDLDRVWVEAKVTPSFPLGYLNGNIILGIGTYFEKNHSFIEYGVGVSKTCKAGFTAGLSYSNWDGLNYVTPSISYSF